LAGKYTVNLTVSNENGTISKTETITALEENNSSGGSSNSGSPEPSTNKGSKKIPDFEIASVIAVLLCVFLYKRR
jgi:PKD repeat protein